MKTLFTICTIGIIALLALGACGRQEEDGDLTTVRVSEVTRHILY